MDHTAGDGLLQWSRLKPRTPASLAVFSKRQIGNYF
jgi:hypothetical protein